MKRCEIKGCDNPAKYLIGKMIDGKKVWLDVCKIHEELIGNENIKRLGRYEKEQK